MPGWTLVDTHPTQGRTFQRPLCEFALGFLWESFINGNGDALYYHELCLSDGSRDVQLFSEPNIVRAWVSTKRRYPLAGATIRGAHDTPLVKVATGFESEPHFVVREHDLTVVRPGEIVFGQVTGAEEAQRQAAMMMHEPRQLSEELLVQLYAFRETDSVRTHVLHLMLLMAHCVSDEIAAKTFVRCLLDTLARGDAPEPAQIPFEERLATTISSTDLQPAHLRSFSPAVQRWRRAVGMVIFRLRIEKIKGGHTLPGRFTSSTLLTAARPSVVSTSLAQIQTDAVIANCRLHDLTFGNAYLALAQVAMTRVLYRRYLRGEISEEEWAYRKRVPHVNGGPFNLRRYLDKAWFENGGGGEFVLSTGLFIFKLPFMTLGATVERHQHIWSDGSPPFAELLTFARFLHRARLAKKQAAAFFSHPLFLEIVHAGHGAYVQYARYRALQWMQQRIETANDGDTHGNEDEDKVLAVTDIPTVWTHGGSTLGNLDLIFPTEYPLPSTHPLSPYSSVPHPAKAGYVTAPSTPPSAFDADTTPKFAVENSIMYPHALPAELYLGAATSRGRMNLYVRYDGNVFEEGVVTEWLDEVREAVLWYLGRTH